MTDTTKQCKVRERTGGYLSMMLPNQSIPYKLNTTDPAVCITVANSILDEIVTRAYLEGMKAQRQEIRKALGL